MINVTLQVEASELGDTFVELFKNIPQEKKESLTLSILKAWLEEPCDFEYSNMRSKIINDFKNGTIKPYWSHMGISSMSNNDILSDPNVKKILDEFKSTKQYMIETIREEVCNYYKKHIREEIEKDPRINEIKDLTYKEICNNIPNIFMKTIILALTNNMVEMQHKVQENIITNYDFSKFSENILKNLDNK